MAIDIFETVQIIEVLENFIDKIRPPEEIRHQVDISYKIEAQSVIIFEIRPLWGNPEKLLECNIAKATFVKSSKLWKIYWQRSDLKWHSYSPQPTVKTLEDFVNIVGEDSLNCFWG